ncbi:hypothetical protein [Lentzea aerocolonigenes]|uniref:hypothetical protein n=1 Tax=Lentzea aerocolonigenes TaxID=68170 RepID=UPI0004C469A3|nr:hypothetical protein [Lentzea aerocolonigenes]MCP2248740.1 hypothetical protein [Lentzea aerocolonigenes]
MDATGWYTTREAVKADLDFKETARTNRIVDRAIAGATRSIEGLMRRKFIPRRATVAFDWPANPRSRSYRLWLDENEFISVDTITVDGVEIPSSSYLLYPSDGPPYDRIEVDRNSSATFSSGTLQQGVLVTGWLGYTDDQEDAGTITAGLDDETTTVLVTDSVTIGVGSIIEVDAERMAVVDKRMVDTTQNLASDLDDDVRVDTVPVGSGAAFTEGEIIMIGAERMLIYEIAGNNLIVQRAWDGSTLAAHTNGADVYAPRSLRVKRGAFGTTATDHADDSTITVWIVPELLEELCAAEAINTLLQKESGYSRRIGSGEGEREASGRGLKELRERAEVLYGRVLS